MPIPAGPSVFVTQSPGPSSSIPSFFSEIPQGFMLKSAVSVGYITTYKRYKMVKMHHFPWHFQDFSKISKQQQLLPGPSRTFGALRCHPGSRQCGRASISPSSPGWVEPRCESSAKAHPDGLVPSCYIMRP